MGRLRSALIVAASLLLAIMPASAWAQQFPALTGRVTDAANVIPPDVEARLTQRLEQLEQQSNRQLVVATVPDLQGYEISDYGYKLGRAWGIGDKETNAGALLLVAPNERKVRIEVGYGLEGTLTDGLSFLIINNDILPRFKAGDLPGGIEAGVNAIATQLQLPPEQAAQVVAQANRPREAEFSLGSVILFVFILLFFISLLRIAVGGRSGGRRYHGSSGPIIWMPGGFGSGGSSGGFGGGFGGGGGGFSGGGGSFGGGGASGGW